MTHDSDDQLYALAHEYLQEEPDPIYRRQIEDLLRSFNAGDKKAALELQDRLVGRLQFGTAGLRAKMEGGYRRFNRVTIAKAAWALGQHLLADKNNNVEASGVVVGFDARNNSTAFAEEVASVLVGLGIKVHVFAETVATPICAFAVMEIGAAAAGMVTASHNPAYDNGFKIYGRRGEQVMGPRDADIERWIEKAPTLDAISRPDVHIQKQLGLRLSIAQDVFDAYFKHVSQSQFHAPTNPSTIKIVYTPLHGVGKNYALRALRDAGFSDVHVVKSQAEPDGNFPTIRFPNPEEEGVLEEAISLAKRISADLILSNDPDADRLAVLVKNPKGNDFVQLTGNEIGALLGADAIEYADVGAKRKLVVSTIVSSRLLSHIAKAADATYVDTLTGFSKIAQVGIEREQKFGEQFIFGYEEALGYCVGNFVRDKDGVSASVRVAELFAFLREKGLSILDALDAISIRYGLFRGMQWSTRFEGQDGAAKMEKLMLSLRQDERLISHLDRNPISRREDLLDPSTPQHLRANVLILSVDQGMQLIIRPSGTEPKIKFYLEAFETVENVEDLANKKAKLDAFLQQAREDLDTQLSLI